MATLVNGPKINGSRVASEDEDQRQALIAAGAFNALTCPCGEMQPYVTPRGNLRCFRCRQRLIPKRRPVTRPF